MLSLLPWIHHGHTPAAMNGGVSRVANVNPCTAAIAAIWLSAMEIVRPDASAADTHRIRSGRLLIKGKDSCRPNRRPHPNRECRYSTYRVTPAIDFCVSTQTSATDWPLILPSVALTESLKPFNSRARSMLARGSACRRQDLHRPAHRPTRHTRLHKMTRQSSRFDRSAILSRRRRRAPAASRRYC